MPAPRPALSVHGHPATVAAPSAKRFQLPPLFKREDLAQGQVCHGELTLQFAARRQYLVHLRTHLALVGIVGIEQDLELEVRLFHLRLVIDQFQTVLNKSFIELGNLRVGKF